ncbi:MAG: hypothetical protein L6R38_008638 [Xanthoria sp. 2 TBL-2021]|nr:MAG: hypothetical protein L6R38_008638 [Xanthoria sp. 2 TBL-2021]
MSASDHQSETSDDALGPNTLDDEDEWKDIEPEDFGTSFVSFGGNTKFLDLKDFLQDAKDNHGVDLLGLKCRHGLETYGMIKLINYAREQIGQGLFRPDASPGTFLEGDRYMKPFMDDDALLYSIDDILDVANQTAHSSANESSNGRMSDEDIQELLKQNDQLREQVKYYRNAYQEAYLENLDLKEGKGSEPKEHSTAHGHNGEQPKRKDHDTHYFSSYDHSDIHETMLRDSVRTDAYRDFIYENKNLFAGKVVLDVGCGSGILSLFCARAGAAKVIAVDNSSIINKAREIVYVNGLSDTIQCLSGKIEELILPVKQVDIIISEWMGYCLMYEAMLDSVLWARDRYLAPDGLMIPSHATLRVSLFADDEEIADKVAYWSSVYGFDMSCMLARAYDEVEIRTVRPKAVPSRSEVILQLPLHTIGKDELTFNGVDFVLETQRDIDQLHGFVIHFDIAFAASREHDIQEAKVTFSTGPSGRETHWQQALALIDTSAAKATSLKRGERVSGCLGLRKGDEKSRDLEVTINWRIRSATAHSEATSQQSWWMH